MYLYGAGGHCKVIIDILRSNNVEIDGVFDDNCKDKTIKNVPILGSISEFNLDINSLIISIGNNEIRKKISNELNIQFGIALHSSSIISDDVAIGNGTVVMHGAIVQSSVKIGKHCIINTSASVDHDCTIEDYVHISPNSTLCGNVKVGEGAQIGAGAVVVPGKKIGKWALVAAGSVVVRDVPDYALVIGNPARVIKIIKKDVE